MNAHLSVLYTAWVVRAEGSASYLAARATSTLKDGTLCQSRNATLLDAFSQTLVCVQLSDDLQHAYWWTRRGYEPIEKPLETAILRTFKVMEKENRYLGGGMPTATHPSHLLSKILRKRLHDSEFHSSGLYGYSFYPPPFQLKIHLERRL